MNSYLEEVRLALGNYYKILQLKGKPVSADLVKDAFPGTHEEVYTVGRLVEYHNETATATLKWSTLSDA
ncbi:MAG TPA: hypothetical protein VGE26_11050 [Sphingobacteriaceae bacterium]